MSSWPSLSTQIPKMPPKFMNTVQPIHQRGNCIPIQIHLVGNGAEANVKALGGRQNGRGYLDQPSGLNGLKGFSIVVFFGGQLKWHSLLFRSLTWKNCAGKVSGHFL